MKPLESDASPMPAAGDEPGVLSRWSRRKQAAALRPGELPTGTPEPETGRPAELAELAEHRQEGVEEEEELLLSDADMPSLDTLDGSSDLSPFFNRGVSAALKKAALRRIFSLPKYNVRDGLDDYDGDYTRFEPLGDTVTCDMRFHAARHEAARLSAAVEAELESGNRLPVEAVEPAERVVSADGQTSPADAADEAPPRGVADPVDQTGAVDESASPVAHASPADRADVTGPATRRAAAGLADPPCASQGPPAERS